MWALRAHGRAKCWAWHRAKALCSFLLSKGQHLRVVLPGNYSECCCVNVTKGDFSVGRSQGLRILNCPQAGVEKFSVLLFPISSYSEPLNVVTGFVIHWDPTQIFHFDLKCVKIPFLASGALYFGEDSWTDSVFWISWYWLTSEDPKYVPIIRRILACYNIWNSTPLCFLIFTEYTPLSILHNWQQETHPKSHSLFSTAIMAMASVAVLLAKERGKGEGWCSSLWSLCAPASRQMEPWPEHMTWGPWSRSHSPPERSAHVQGTALQALRTAWSLELDGACFGYGPRHLLAVTLSQLLNFFEPQFPHLIVMPISYDYLKG